MRRIGLAALTAVLVVTIGCVMSTKHQITAHITVDIRHIKEQADDIIGFIEGETDELPPLAAEGAPAAEGDSDAGRLLHHVREVMAPVQVAYAQDLNQDSPRVREIAVKLRDRRAKIAELKAKGYIGEDNRGYVAVRPHDDLADDERKNEVQRIVAAENEDRKDLYKEVVRLNADRNATLSVVERVFAQAYLKRGKSGEHFQLPPEGADFDVFKASAPGKKLGDAAKPGAWVELP